MAEHGREKARIEKWVVKQHHQLEQTKHKIQWILGLDTYISTKRDKEFKGKGKGNNDQLVRRSWSTQPSAPISLNQNHSSHLLYVGSPMRCHEKIEMLDS